MTRAFDKNTPTSSVNDRIKPPAPVFEIDQVWYETDEPIPCIWVTEPVFDVSGEQCGRTYVMPYPWEDMPDPNGSLALSFGSDYYREGMSYSDAEDRQTRIDCFRAAEILYLHAAAKGNVDAYLDLGYIYSYDRCEGHYYVDHRHTEDVEDYMRPYPVKSARSNVSLFRGGSRRCRSVLQAGRSVQARNRQRAERRRSVRVVHARLRVERRHAAAYLGKHCAASCRRIRKTASAAHSICKRRWTGTRRRRQASTSGSDRARPSTIVRSRTCAPPSSASSRSLTAGISEKELP